MSTRNDSAIPSEEREFGMERVFDAPRDLVWKACTEAERLMQWWGPKDVTMRAVPIHATEAERKTFEGAFASLQQGSKGTFDQLAEYLAKVER